MCKCHLLLFFYVPDARALWVNLSRMYHRRNELKRNVTKSPSYLKLLVPPNGTLGCNVPAVLGVDAAQELYSADGQLGQHRV